MGKFTNSVTGEKNSKTLTGGEQIDPVKLEALVADVKALDGKLDNLQTRSDELKSDTKENLKTQENWLFAGFIALLVIVAGLLIAVGAIWNDYLVNKQATYQSLLDKVRDQESKIDTLTNEIHRQKGFR